MAIGFMQDGGSLDLVMKAGRIPVDMIAKITFAVSMYNIASTSTTRCNGLPRF